jgi:hypothetical protein
VDILEQLWTGKKPDNEAPHVEYMLLAGKGSRDDILLRSGRSYMAEVVASDADSDSLKFEWYVYAENWYKPTFDEEKDIIPILHTTSAKNDFTFVAPEQRGAYRVAVKVFDGKNKFGTANIPFYVVN